MVPINCQPVFLTIHEKVCFLRSSHFLTIFSVSPLLSLTRCCFFFYPSCVVLERGDELTLRAVSDALGVKIHIVTTLKENWLLHYEPDELKVCCLLDFLTLRVLLLRRIVLALLFFFRLRYPSALFTTPHITVPTTQVHEDGAASRQLFLSYVSPIHYNTVAPVR